MKASVLRYAAIGMASLSLAGFAAASTVTITKSGPQSNNKVNLQNSASANSFNLNGTGVSNLNEQGAASGNVKEEDNTTVSGGGSGDASNTNSTSTTVSNNNSGVGAGTALAALVGGMGSGADVTLDTTGPQSNNQVDVKNSVKMNSTNLNLTEVQNESVQAAQSGNVEIKDNTTASGGSSGNASNNNSTVNTVSNSN